MGFWDSVGKFAGTVAGAAVNKVKEVNEQSQIYKIEMAEKSDDDLAYIVKRESSSSLKRTAAFQELKSRGYSTEDIKYLVQRV